MRQYFDYFDYIDYFDDNRENKSDTFLEADEKIGEEEKSSGLVEGEKDPGQDLFKRNEHRAAPHQRR